MSEPVMVDGGTGNIAVGRTESGKTVLLIKPDSGNQIQLHIGPEVVAKLINGLAVSLTWTIDDLNRQLVEWIGVG